MNRAARPGHTGSGTPPPGATPSPSDDSAHPTGLNGATFDPDPEPKTVQLTLADAYDAATAAPPAAPGPSEAAAATVSEPSPKAAAKPSLKPAIRVVGAPTPPGAPRESTDIALKSLPVAVVSKRRMAWIIGLAVTIWVVAVFARQVGEASAAADHADVIRDQNAALGAQVAALQQERDTVQQQSFIEFQARSFGLGTAQEKRFTLAADAPPLPSNAPGSASVKLAPPPAPQTPLDAWLSMLFGPSP